MRRYPAYAASPVTMPIGIAKRNTLGTKPGRYRRVFGASARKKPGIPMVRVEIIVSWIGASGKAPSVPAAMSASTRE